MARATPSDDLLRQLFDVLSSPLGMIARGLSELLSPAVTHSALAMLSADASGGRIQWWGDPRLHRDTSGLHLEHLRTSVDSVEGVHETTLNIGRAQHPVLQVVARNGALLVLVDPAPNPVPGPLLDIWNIVSLHVQERADEAAPEYLRHARSTAGVRLLALSEITEEYTTTLEGILVPLRAGRLSDASARDAALVRSVAGLDRLRAMSEQARALAEEAVGTSFARLTEELRSAARYWSGDLEFIEPSDGRRQVPDDVARGASSVVQRVFLSRMQSSEVSRVRVQWQCSATALVVDLRDDGAGDGADADVLLESIRQRVEALRGQFSFTATSGWGAELSMILPLEPPPVRPAAVAMASLRPREVQVAHLLVGGHRNRAIARSWGSARTPSNFTSPGFCAP